MRNPLRRLRLHHGLTIKEVAVVAGYSLTWVSYVERGVRKDTDGTLRTALDTIINGHGLHRERKERR